MTVVLQPKLQGHSLQMPAKNVGMGQSPSIVYAESISNPLVVARAGSGDVCILSALAKRRGCIAGGTGTGKTVTLQRLAERFSGIGVPVFLADIKGDMGGLAIAGASSPKLNERLSRLGIEDATFQQPRIALTSSSAASLTGTRSSSGHVRSVTTEDSFSRSSVPTGEPKFDTRTWSSASTPSAVEISRDPIPTTVGPGRVGAGISACEVC